MVNRIDSVLLFDYVDFLYAGTYCNNPFDRRVNILIQHHGLTV